MLLLRRVQIMRTNTNGAGRWPALLSIVKERPADL